jgi:NADH-quinone oxidoreductase subunit M
MGISWLIFLPVAAAIVLLFVPRSLSRLLWGAALLATLIVLALAIVLYVRFDADDAGLQFAENVEWIPQFGISYHVGLDGLSLLLVMLTALMGPVVVLASWGTIKKHEKEFVLSLLVLQGAMVGVFTAWDLFLFYVFWEAVLIPMYFLIGVWGSSRRIYATIKFFIFTMAGSLLMLVAVIILYLLCGAESFDFDHIFSRLPEAALPLLSERWLFAAFFLAFAIKVPLFPVHTWLPDAHTEAPMAGSVILAGVLLKMGTYGIARLALPLFPHAAQTLFPYIAALSIVGIIYGAMVAMVQTDVKRLVAYSSVSHLGFVVLGLIALNAQGLEGGFLQMINHGLSTGALFMVVGFLYQRTHSRLIADHGGLASTMPVFSVIFGIVMLSSIGLPGLNGFVGEFLILLGAFRANPWWGALAATGMVLSACYMLWVYKRIVWGVPRGKAVEVSDLTVREVVSFLPLLVFIVWIGVFPETFLSKMRASSHAYLSRIEMALQDSESDEAAVTASAAPQWEPKKEE